MARKRKSATVTLRLHEEHKKRIQRAADQVGMSLTEFITEAVDRVLRRGGHKRWKE